ncbi:MAG: hypothetical protein AW07_00378 [Candidatus Accumulibacter sp. SK-11]|nr:MAG: hypothetical protein AW07_00378 [Candidatus Accumulibacter sp. SK-11]
MTPVVIDTNVLLVANGSHQDVSCKCREGAPSGVTSGPGAWAWSPFRH